MRRTIAMITTGIRVLAGCSGARSTAPSGQLLLQKTTIGVTDSRSMRIDLDFARAREGEVLEGVCFPLTVDVEREVNGRWTRVPTTFLSAGSQPFTVRLPDPVTRLGSAAGTVDEQAPLRIGDKVRVTLLIGGQRVTSTTRDVVAGL